jgi:hypothetical protein
MKTMLRLSPLSLQDMKECPVLGYMKTIFRLLPLSFAICLCGCGPGYNFSPYVGQQANWATGAGSYVKMVDHAQIYSPGQLPPRPYIILGAVSTDSEDNLAKAVREQHADAAIISNESSYRNGSVVWAAPGVTGVTPLRHTVISANLIKYK